MRIPLGALVFIFSVALFFLPAQTSAQSQQSQFWSASETQQCAIVREWGGLQADSEMSFAISSRRNIAWRDQVHRFHNPRFIEHFGKPYASLTRSEKRTLHKLAEECLPPNEARMAALFAFDTSSSRSARQYREDLEQSVALINGAEFTGEVESRRQARRQRETANSIFDGHRYSHDDGELFFQNAEVKLYWPHTRRVYTDGPCIFDMKVFAELQESRSHLVTPPDVLALYFDYVLPSAQQDCGAQLPSGLSLQIYIADTYLDTYGRISTKEAIATSGLDESPLAQAYFPTNLTQADISAARVKYKADDRIGMIPNMPLSEYLPFVGSVDALQDYIARGGRTPQQLAEAQRRESEAARFRAANPAWPEGLEAQADYIKAGHFTGLFYDRSNDQLILPIFYLEAYSRRCAPNTRAATYDVLAAQSRWTGQTTTYSPIGRTGLLQTRDETTQDVVTFATVRADQRPLVDTIRQVSGSTTWPNLRRFASASPAARIQDQQVQQLGCDTPAMRAYERNLSSFVAKIAEGWSR